ncbi:MAG: hypothetical protein IPL32_07975 [Chloracidobacterium sp.]|nr:hypothetical protein [Chloracidobacterium sp.]
MTYILTKDRLNNSYEEWQAGYSAYSAYLKSVKHRLPRCAYEFAAALWHYNFEDHRSPHDGWLEEIIIRESAFGERAENRSFEIVVRLFAAYHDGHIEFKYSDVQGYSLASDITNGRGHGDWLYDEVRLSERGWVLHEIEWSRGGLWLIECIDVAYKWMPLGSAEAAVLQKHPASRPPPG